jgi:DNA-directed RNA polymerase specialized sigma24 family protein
MQPLNTVQTDWFEGIRTANDQVLTAVFDQFQDRILQELRQKGAPAAIAEDIFMDVLEAIFRKAQIAEAPFFEQDKFGGYLQQACLFQWYKLTRRNKFAAQVTPEELRVPSDEPTIDLELQQTERSRLFWQVFKTLDDLCQQVLRRFLVEEDSLQTIADAMGYTYEYAKKKKYRCNKELVERIKAHPLYAELKV